MVLSCIVAGLAMPYPMPYPFPDEPGYGQPAYSPPSYGTVGRVKIQVSNKNFDFFFLNLNIYRSIDRVSRLELCHFTMIL